MQQSPPVLHYQTTVQSVRAPPRTLRSCPPAKGGRLVRHANVTRELLFRTYIRHRLARRNCPPTHSHVRREPLREGWRMDPNVSTFPPQQPVHRQNTTGDLPDPPTDIRPYAGHPLAGSMPGGPDAPSTPRPSASGPAPFAE
eukprot:364050-Chlamydomonas_euryale.AAC.19